MKIRLAALCGLAAVSFPSAFAQGAEPYAPASIESLIGEAATYDPAIPKPEDVVGYAAGEIIFPPEMLQAYVRAVAEASDRVSVEQIGESHFGRPILRVTTTSPANQARLEEIRQAHVARSAGRGGAAAEDAPVVVQFTHGVHGNESSGFDAAATILYHLAAAQDDDTRRLLEETVLNQIVLINPDGAHRFATHVNQLRARNPVADPQHPESALGGGRQNHYGFDLNRQWIPVTQPEAVALVRATHEWAPNLAADFHEMGSNSTYFFSPGPVDGLHPLLSQDGLALTQRLNETVEARLDRDGTLYVSEEFFDDFYLGYGSSYPGLIGGVAYLFEQSSARGLVQDTDHGLARYDEKIGGQTRAGLALLRAAHARRGEMLEFQRSFAAETRRLAQNDEFGGYVFRSDDAGRIADFLDVLDVHGIEVRRLAADARFGGQAFPAEDSFIVPLDQPVYRVIRGLFENRIVTSKTAFYDVSGWTQPLAWDLDVAPVPRRQGANLLGEQVEGVDRAGPTPDATRYAYVLDWTHFRSPRALYRLLASGLRAQVIPDSVTVETTRGEVRTRRGAVVLPVQGQDMEPAEIQALVQRIAREDGVTFHAALTGATREGSDLGGFALETLEEPQVLVFYGEGVSTTGWGEVWHLLDHEMGMPVTLMEPRHFGRASLDAYTHIILPNGWYSDLGEDEAARLGEFARNGGVIIGLEGGADVLANHEISSAQGYTAEHDATRSEPPADYASIEDWDTRERISGAIFAATADISHPLLYGVTDPRLPVHVTDAGAFAKGDNPFATPITYDEAGLLSGYATDAAQADLAGGGFVHAERVGSGSVILFADPPWFRAYTRGTGRVLLNAIFYGKAFRNPSRRTE